MKSRQQWDRRDAAINFVSTMLLKFSVFLASSVDVA